MRVLDIVLLIIAAVCFALAAVGVAARINWLGAGLLAWVLVPLIALINA